jgi:hypothetical protein
MPVQIFLSLRWKVTPRARFKTVSGRFPRETASQSLMGDQAPSIRRGGPIPAGAEDDVLAEGIGAGAQRARRPCGAALRMHPDPAEVVAEAGLEVGARPLVERLAERAQRLLGGSRERSAPLGHGLQLRHRFAPGNPDCGAPGLPLPCAPRRSPGGLTRSSRPVVTPGSAPPREGSALSREERTPPRPERISPREESSSPRVGRRSSPQEGDSPRQGSVPPRREAPRPGREASRHVRWRLATPGNPAATLGKSPATSGKDLATPGNGLIPTGNPPGSHTSSF